jgi:hypothetical protein
LRRLAAGGQELVDQVAVRAVDFEDLEPCLVGAGGGLAPVAEQLGDFLVAECTRHRHPVAVGQRAGRHQVPTIPVEHLRMVGRQRKLALPRAGEARLTAGMTDLEAGRGTLGLDEAGDALQAGDEFIHP